MNTDKKMVGVKVHLGNFPSLEESGKDAFKSDSESSVL